MFRRVIVPTNGGATGWFRRGVQEFWRNPEIAGSTKVQTGRAWEARELRRKSFEDLHKLWYVCLKERNLLESERLAARASHRKWPKPGRLVKVKKTMARIKTVVNERSREYKALQAEQS
mmetsp:Transcript_3972/g.4586  ORF Transcript_3972/g.4586 Transcript_3972/m.4586 type:complete len:119 (-) Transcript_3972:307-663(-)